MPTSLGDKHFVVTGGSGDIGRAMARALAVRGARVTIFDLVAPPSEALEVSDGKDHDGNVVTFEQVDVSDREGLRSALRRIPPFDGVIGNAGVSHSAPFLEISDEEWSLHQNVNLTGNFHLGQEAARIMKQRGEGGVIIFTGSWVQDIPWPEIAAYSASKAGLAMLMKSMALELAKYNIRVNVIAPGIVKAGMAKYQMENEPQYAQRIKNVVPLGRLQIPEDVADATAFLCSDDARYMTGTTLLVDGGCSLFQFDN